MNIKEPVDNEVHFDNLYQGHRGYKLYYNGVLVYDSDEGNNTFRIWLKAKISYIRSIYNNE
jgi:hypothetical protein